LNSKDKENKEKPIGFIFASLSETMSVIRSKINKEGILPKN